MKFAVFSAFFLRFFKKIRGFIRFSRFFLGRFFFFAAKRGKPLFQSRRFTSKNDLWATEPKVNPFSVAFLFYSVSPRLSNAFREKPHFF